MTDQELDKMMRRVLSDAIKLDCISDGEQTVSFEPSLRHQQQIQSMLKNPLNWARKKICPLWKQALQRIAVTLLVISVGFGGVMAVSPTARTAVIRWFVEWYETHIVYRYAGNSISEVMPQYTIVDLPDGYDESERIVNRSSVSVVYENNHGGIICLDYNHIHEGGINVFDSANDDMDEILEVTVGGNYGQLFIPKNPDALRTITWIDDVKNIQFVLIADLDNEAILRMAESVAIKK